MKIKITGIIFVVFFIGSCTSLSSYKKERDYLKDWKLDIAGCKGLRTMEQARYIYGSMDGKGKRFIINKIGKPDTLRILEPFILDSVEVKNAIILTYYFETQCKCDSLDYYHFDLWLVSNKVRVKGITSNYTLCPCKDGVPR